MRRVGLHRIEQRHRLVMYPNLEVIIKKWYNDAKWQVFMNLLVVFCVFVLVHVLNHGCLCLHAQEGDF